MKNKPIILAHYMPWFSTAPHWRHWRGESGRFNPEETGEHGRRKIAAHQYPLCGPYSSTNPDTIDRHLRQMKDFGIDGLIVDWYGVGVKPDGKTTYHDYAAIHDTVTQVWEIVKDHPTQLKLGLMFDGHCLGAVCDAGRAGLTSESPEDYARRSLAVAQADFFGQPRYLKHSTPDGEHPVVLVFCWPKVSPVTCVEWPRVVAEVNPKLLLFSQDTKVAWAGGVFFWPNVPHAEGADEQHDWRDATKHVPEFCNSAEAKSAVVMGMAFPGFDDIYLDDDQKGKHKKKIVRGNDGETYRDTLTQALSFDCVQYVQIVTWNDWGEGTQIEPSAEFGTRELETTRQLLDAT